MSKTEINTHVKAFSLLPEGTTLLSGDVLPNFFEKMPNGVAYCKMLYRSGKPYDFIYLYTNPVFHSLTGVGTVVGKHGSHAIPGFLDSSPEMLSIYNRVAGGGDANSFEIYFEPVQQWFSVQVFSPKPEHFFATFNVINQRAISQQELIEREKRLAGLLEDQTEMICRFKADGTILFVNEAFCKLFGKSRKSIMGTTWHPAAWPEDVPLVEEKLKTLSPENPVVLIENRIIDGAGQIRWGQFINRAFFDRNGSLLEIQTVARDITQQKQEEANKLEIYNRLAQISSRVPGVIYQYKLRPDGSSCFPYASEAIRDIYRVTPEEVKEDATAVLSLLHPDDYNGIVKSIQRSATMLEPWQHEYRVRFADGDVRWLYGNAIPNKEKQPDGSVIWNGFITDITEQKAMQQCLQESQEMFATLFYKSPVGIAISRLADGSFIHINDAFLQMQGYQREEILGKSSKELGLWHDLEQREQVISKTREHGFVVNEDLKTRHKSGVIKHCLASFHQIIISGEPCLLGLVTDISERKQSEEELRIAAAAFETEDGIVVVDENKAIIRVNNAFTRLTGYSAEEAINLTFFISSRHRTDFFREMWDSIANYGHWHGELTEQRKNGEFIPLSLSISAIKDQEGQVTHYVGIFSDITVRKQHEALLRNSEERDKLRHFVDHVPMGIAMLDLEMYYLAVSKRWMQDYGLSGDIIGRSHYEVLPEIPERWKEIHRRCLLGEVINASEDPFVRTDGTVQWLKWEVAPWYAASGEVSGIVISAEDITESIQTKMALQDTENQLQLIMNLTPALVSYLDTDFRYVRINKTYEDWWGITPSHIVGSTVPDLVGEKTWSIVQPHLEKARSGETVRYDHPLWFHEDKIRWVSVTYIPDIDAFGKVNGIVAHIADIDERKRAEQEITQLNQSLSLRLGEMQAIFDTAPIGLSITEDLEGKQMHGNPVLEQMMGLPWHSGLSFKTIASNAYQVFDGKSKLTLDQLPMQRAIRGETVTNKILEIHRPDGEIRTVLSNATPLINELGSPRGAVGAFLDITGLKSAEDALQQNEARLSIILNELKAGYWHWDLLTNAVFYSPEWKQQLGFADNELSNCYEEWESRLHPDDREKTFASVDNYLQGKSPAYEVEFRLQHKDGTYRWIHSRASVLHKGDNGHKHFIGIHLDVTDFKWEQEFKIRREKMGEVWRSLIASQTAIAIAHDLNQPLTAVIYFADAAADLQQKGQITPQALSQMLENCSEQAHRASKVVPQLMALLKNVEVIDEPVIIKRLIVNTVEIIKAESLFSSLAIKLDIATDLPLVNFNELLLQNVLLVIIRNGLESMLESSNKEGGLSITARIFPDDTSLLQVTVCDSGTGVSDNTELKKIFRSFYNAKTGSVGMGLAICRSLIESHGGAFWPQQNADVGLSVHFTLPFIH